MRAIDLILKKRNGGELDGAEIEFLINSFLSGTIPDYQISAWLMAAWFSGLSLAETTHLTRVMIESGTTLRWPYSEFRMVDKHSTGGVGDKTTLVVAPIIASLGVPVAKLSGRGLGHTGGTLDKLEAFTGIRLDLSPEEIANQVKAVGLCITGQTEDLVPADRELYALRDVTATVDQFGLVASSIISKKIALGADAIVLDVKCGDGGFNDTFDKAQKLSELLVSLAESFGKTTVALITDMNQPLGRSIGNTLEIIEVLETLKGEGSPDLTELCYQLAGEALVLSGKTNDLPSARKMISETVNSGAALVKLKEMVNAQGGSTSIIDDLNQRSGTKYSKDLIAKEDGTIQGLSARAVGDVAMTLGAGRKHKADIINLASGIYLHRKPGETVQRGDAIATLYSDQQAALEESTAKLQSAFKIGGRGPTNPVVMARVTKEGSTSFSPSGHDSI